MAHIFISYSHKDSEYAHRLADKVQAQGFNVWIDARLDYGSHWPLEIQKQLDSCDALILVMSPHSYDSEWVQNELARAKRKLKPIFPLLLEGDETWLSVEARQYYDVRGGRMPDAKFYSDLSHAVPPSEGQPVPSPAEANHIPATTTVKPPRPMTGYVVMGVGVMAVLVAAVLIFWSMNSRRSASPPEDHIEEPTSTASSGNIVAPSPVATESIPAQTLPTDTPDTAELTDSKGVAMQFVAAGNFIAGSDNGYPEEKPVHTVYLNDFYIDKYEVTNALYKACVDAGACQPPDKTGSFTRSSYFGDPEFDNYPVVFVSWEEAQAYCQWRGMKLPTEAQWEKAARGTDGRVYP